MIDVIYSILGMPLTVCCEHMEVMKNFIIIDIHLEQSVPPHDAIIHSFEGRCARSDFRHFDLLNREGEGLAYGQPLLFYAIIKGKNIPFHMDSYEIIHPYVVQSEFSNFPIPSQHSEAIISGHFDSRDFKDLLSRTPFPLEKKKQESIDSRFDILDL